MPSDDTEAKLAAALRDLRRDQEAGAAPPPGEVSLNELARRAGLSTSVVHRYEQTLLAKLYKEISARGIRPQELRTILALLS